jgi:uncharacterized protein (TIGR03435 family)
MRATLSVSLISAIVMLLTTRGNSQPRAEFEAATIKPSQVGRQAHSNFPLHGEAYVPNGGLFTATNFPMATYIFFAYNIDGNQSKSLVPQLPRWVMTDRFDIQARGWKSNEGRDASDDACVVG